MDHIRPNIIKLTYERAVSARAERFTRDPCHLDDVDVELAQERAELCALRDNDRVLKLGAVCFPHEVEEDIAGAADIRISDYVEDFYQLASPPFAADISVSLRPMRTPNPSAAQNASVTR